MLLLPLDNVSLQNIGIIDNFNRMLLVKRSKTKFRFIRFTNHCIDKRYAITEIDRGPIRIGGLLISIIVLTRASLLTGI